MRYIVRLRIEETTVVDNTMLSLTFFRFLPWNLISSTQFTLTERKTQLCLFDWNLKFSFVVLQLGNLIRESMQCSIQLIETIQLFLNNTQFSWYNIYLILYMWCNILPCREWPVQSDPIKQTFMHERIIKGKLTYRYYLQ